LEGKIKTIALYKPDLKARFLVDKMVQSEKCIQEVLTKLMTHLKSIKRKVDTNISDLGMVWEKVELTMTSINMVQEDQVDFAKLLKKNLGINQRSNWRRYHGCGPSHGVDFLGRHKVSSPTTTSC
jgi:hypothetical protein